MLDHCLACDERICGSRLRHALHSVLARGSAVDDDSLKLVHSLPNPGLAQPADRRCINGTARVTLSK